MTEISQKENIILFIYAGTGGKDAEDWAAMLLRMYQRYCEKQGFKNKIVEINFTEVKCENRQGIKTAVLKIEKNHNPQSPWEFLRDERGVHRLVRQSPFSAKKLRHTSFAQIDIIPAVSEKAQREIKINPTDLKIDVFCSSGPGGQNVNKRETAVRITHLPTNIKVVCQSERTQLLNKEEAINILYSKLYQLYQQQQKQEIEKGKSKIFVHWGSQIRSYILHPYQLVKDHQYNVKTANVTAVLDGNLELIKKKK
jgi:peptide chain release factor 2